MKLYVKDVKINPTKICGRILDKEARLFAADTAYRLMFDYIPYDSGMLAEAVNIYDEEPAGVIHFTQPYAHRIYSGTGFRFNTDKHRYATAHWDRAAMDARREKLIRSVQDYLR